jgi:hypothetical protein
MDHSRIFERHYFSNHHTEAINLEKRLEKEFPKMECVTFSNIESLWVAVIDEICEDNINLYSKTGLNTMERINRFFKATKRRQMKNWSTISKKTQQLVQNIVPINYLDFLVGTLTDKDKLSGIFLDFGKCSEFISSAPIFISNNKMFCEKIRWARSSYGRRFKISDLKIASNGRFSEFQGLIVNSFLDNN